RDQVGEVREPAVTLARRGYRHLPDLILLGDAPLVVGKEERLSLHDGAAGGEAELVRVVPALLEAARVLEELRRLEAVVTVELPGAPVELVGAGLEGGAEDGPARAAVFGPE